MAGIIDTSENPSEIIETLLKEAGLALGVFQLMSEGGKIGGLDEAVTTDFKHLYSSLICNFILLGKNIPILSRYSMNALNDCCETLQICESLVTLDA